MLTVFPGSDAKAAHDIAKPYDARARSMQSGDRRNTDSGKRENQKNVRIFEATKAIFATARNGSVSWPT